MLKHDSTVIAFLTLLGVKVHSNPTYSSAVLLELYQQNDKYFVSLRYRNNTFDDKIVELSIPGEFPFYCHVSSLCLEIFI